MPSNLGSSPRPAAVIIIGAPRSGTNVLRDALARLPGTGTWPCDEINYIWRHGNARFPSDELTADLARPEVVSYIRNRFDGLAARYGLELIIEKTCANSLRVDFVDAVLGEHAKFIFLRRHGIDVVASALERWRAPLDIPYIARKARYVPLTDIPYYSSRYLWNRLHRLRSSERRLALWGPQLADTRELLDKYPLEVVCAIQWKRCVDGAADSLAKIPRDRVIDLSYEGFVSAPAAELSRLLDFLRIPFSPELVETCIAGVVSGSVGKGQRALGDDTVARIMPFIRDTLERYAYV